MANVNFSSFNEVEEENLDIEHGAIHNETVEDEDVQEGWDEGGRSDCGYPDSVHDTLMSIGRAMHSFFGEPSDTLQDQMKGIGSCFQEASYTVRDFQRSGNVTFDCMDEKGGFLFLEAGDDNSDELDVISEVRSMNVISAVSEP